MICAQLVKDYPLSGTRFHDGQQRLLYGQLDRKTWSIFHQEGREYPGRVGPHYRTKVELLADLDRYAKEWGFE